MIANLDLFTPTEPKLKPRTEHALRMLREHPEGLTTNEARALGCGDRFAARVLEIRKALGETAVTDEWESHGEARYKRYHLTR